MPMFEFKCMRCGKKFAQLVGMTTDSSQPACPKCGSVELSKLISRFSRLRSEDEKLDSIESAAMSADMDDPANMHKWAKEMGEEMGDDVGEDFEGYLDEA